MKKLKNNIAILEAKDGIINRVEFNGAEYFVGQETLSGGKILTLKLDFNTSGGMYAEIGKLGVQTSINGIVLPGTPGTEIPGMYINYNGLIIKFPKANEINV